MSQTPRNDGSLDQYAYEVSLHQSDLLWVSAKGIVRQNCRLAGIHRETPPTQEEDPFGDDFEDSQSEDPFGEYEVLNSITIAAHSLILRNTPTLNGLCKGRNNTDNVRRFTC